ncbi:hypothetical protein SOY_00680, partial [Enterococcus faecalis EnGen0210]
GEVVFTEQDGIKKEVNYGIETDLLSKMV